MFEIPNLNKKKKENIPSMARASPKAMVKRGGSLEDGI